MFEQIFEDFVFLIKEVIENRKIFVYVSKEHVRTVEVNSIEYERRTNTSHYSLKLQGRDPYGIWEGAGCFLMADDSFPLFWMLKYYSDKSRSRTIGEFDSLIYESTLIEKDRVEGKWFFEEMEKSVDYSGTWAIEGKLEDRSNEFFDIEQTL